MKRALQLFLLCFLIGLNSVAQSLMFDGVNDAVSTSVTNNATTYANWTYECWVQSSQAPNGSLGIDGPMYSENMGIVWNHSSLQFRGAAMVRDASGAYYAASFGTLAASTWYHLAATYDGTHLRAYRNGELITETTTGGGVFPSTNYLALGVHPTGSNYFEGVLDEVRVWNTARTCTEINNNMNTELTGAESGLTAYYKFNEGVPLGNNTSISYLYNTQSSTNDGLLIGFALNGSLTSNFGFQAPLNAASQSCGTGLAANSLKFDGYDDEVIFVNNPAFQINSGTIEAWIKTSDAGPNYRGIVVKEFAYGLFLKNNILTAFHWSSGTEHSGGPALNDNQWHHVAYVFYSTVPLCQLYIDGVPVGSTFSHAVTNQTVGLKIGNNGSQTHFFNGYIDEVRLWERPLCVTEITNRKNCEIPTNTTGLIGNFHFNQGTDAQNNAAQTTLLNSASSVNGTLANFTLDGLMSNWRDASIITTGTACTFYPANLTQTATTLTSTITDATATYQWYDCSNNPIPGENSQSFTPTVSGSYYVVITINGCVMSSDCATINVTGINETSSAADKLKIYPNPTSSILNIKVKEQTQITIVNVLGEVVKTETINGLAAIDVSALNSGVYFIQTNNGVNLKFIKQ
jgi:hypothetical protein